MKTLYINLMRGSRSFARRLGILRALEKSPNRTARWIRSLFSIYDSADLASLDLPWWTYPAIDEIERKLKHLQGHARVFEYGAGASTVWLAKRCGQVISVEHDTGFAASMQSTFAAHENINLMVVTDIAATGTASEARSLRKGYEDRSFDDYVASISAHPGEFDLIVIDGRARTACLSMAIPRLAKNGVILFDNSDREEYRTRIESSGLDERRLRGMAPALPFPSQTSLLERRS